MPRRAEVGEVSVGWCYRRTANQTEGAYRVGESRVQLLERHVWLPASGSCESRHQVPPERKRAESETPRLRAGAGGASETLPRPVEDGFTRVLVWQSLHQFDLSDANLASAERSAVPHRRRSASGHSSARATPRRPGRSPAAACLRVGGG